MTPKSRIVLEVFGPAPLGTVFLSARYHEAFARLLDQGPQAIAVTFLLYLVFAYAFALVPSLLYSLLMEWWLRKKPLGAAWRTGTIALSTMLGFGAGYAVSRASEVPVTWIGAIVGLILGIVLSRNDAGEHNFTGERR